MVNCHGIFWKHTMNQFSEGTTQNITVMISAIRLQSKSTCGMIYSTTGAFTHFHVLTFCLRHFM